MKVNLKKPRRFVFIAGAVLVFLGLLPFVCVGIMVEVTLRENVAKKQQRAEQGDPNAQEELGYWHLTGIAENRSGGLVKKDNKKALLWLGKAAQQNYSFAYSGYALALERDGQNKAAFQWYEKAVKQKGGSQEDKEAVRDGALRLKEVYEKGELGQAVDLKRANYYRKIVQSYDDHINDYAAAKAHQ